MSEKENQGKITVRICCGINCSVHGGQELLDSVESDAYLTSHCNIIYNECLEFCEEGKNSPIVEIEGKPFLRMTPERLTTLLTNEIQGLE